MSEQKTTLELLHEVQINLKAPKGQYNSFGKYKYRKCEDILESAKKVLPSGCCIMLSDEIVQVGDRYYVKATARFHKSSDAQGIHAVAFAREEEMKKGMDGAQITGSASSYARKYALSGLLAIDDTEDADTHEQPIERPQPKPINTAVKNDYVTGYTKISQDQAIVLIDLIRDAGKDLDKCCAFYKVASIEDLPLSLLDKVTDMLKNAISKKGAK